ncbi:hypothetical protein PQX77_020590 [Marasmius sp. AFHP31]|nr:hypothetical protein PQX77_020590 [Marasmius sp. AFHP31]
MPHIPRLPFLIRLSYSKYNGLATTVEGRDPKLCEDDFVQWLSHVPNDFWTYTQYTDCFEIPAVDKLPLRYRSNSDFIYHAEGEHNTCGTTFNPFTFYEYCKDIRWSHECQSLYSSSTGRRLCFDRPYSTFRRSWDALSSLGVVWTSAHEILRAVEQHTGRSFIDGEVFAYRLFNNEDIPWPHEFGLLDNSWI